MQLTIDLRTLDDHFPGIARYGYELALALLRLPAGPELSVILPTAPRTRFDLGPLLAGAAGPAPARSRSGRCQESDRQGCGDRS